MHLVPRTPGRRPLLVFCVLVLVLLLPAAATRLVASISGTVVEEGTGTPIAGARVHVQTDLSTVVISAVDGSFTLPTAPAVPSTITAAVPYDRGQPANWLTGATVASDGDVGVVIELRRLPTADVASYDPDTSQLCNACHQQITAAWAPSEHARAATNEWVLDLFSGTGTPGGSAGYVFRDTHDADDTGFCATCHAPLADALDPGNVFLDEVTDAAALEGVSCLACHQIDSVDGDVNALHHLGNSTYRFPDDAGFSSPEQFVWGPLDDVDFGFMRASYAPFFETSELCASCHQYVNPTTGAPGQSTYEEWLASPYAQPGPGHRECQDCHEPPSAAPDVACEAQGLERPGDQVHAHDFIGSTPTTLADAFLVQLVAAEAGGVVEVSVDVTNAGAGHAFPTGVSIRNGLLLVEATLSGQPLTQLSGPTLPFWADDDVPGTAPGDYAGLPGKGYARVLEGRINGQGPVVRPVLFIDAEGVFSDTRLPSGETDTVEVSFALPPGAAPGDVVEVRARLLYRRAWRATYVTKGWTETPGGLPLEIEIADEQQQLTLVEGGGTVLEIPTLDRLGAALFSLLLGGIALFWLRRR